MFYRHNRIRQIIFQTMISGRLPAEAAKHMHTARSLLPRIDKVRYMSSCFSHIWRVMPRFLPQAATKLRNISNLNRNVHIAHYNRLIMTAAAGHLAE